MARSKNNIVTFGASGALGKQFVFRQRNGKTFICKMPRPFDGPPTASQVAVRQRFSQANDYAKASIANPTTKSMYQAAAKSGQSAYCRAFSDAFHAPEIREIRAAGKKLLLKVWDDFRVQQVSVKITNEWGFEEETGNANYTGSGILWEYGLRGNIDGMHVEVEARDLPGNVERKRFEG